MPIAEEYLSYTEKWKQEYGEKTIVLIQVGSFFEVYALEDKDGKRIGSDIERFAAINDMIIAQTNKKPVRGMNVVMAGFGLSQLEKYVNKLQEHGYTIVVYRQDIQGKNTTRSLDQIISPGTFFSLETEKLSNTSMCLWIERINERRSSPESVIIGLATPDIYTGKSTLQQTMLPYHHNPTTYDDIERCVAIHQPMECIIVTNMSDQIVSDIISFTSLDTAKLHIVNHSNVTSELTKHSKKAEKQTYQNEFFKRFFPNLSEETVATAIMQSHSLAVQSFVLLVDFICTHSPHLTTRLLTPSFETETNKLVLANHSLKQLNILEDDRHAGKLRSVGSFLNNCITAMGKRKFLYDLHNPTCDEEILNESYQVTANVMETGEWQEYRSMLTGIHDMDKLQRKVAMKKVTPKDFAWLYHDLNKISKLCNKTIAKQDNVTRYVIKCGDPTQDCIDIMETLNETFNLDKCVEIDCMSTEKLCNMSSENLTFIKEGASNILDKLVYDCLNSRIQLEAIAQKLSSIVALVETKTKAVNTLVKIHETAKSEPVLMATKRRVTLLKSHINRLNNRVINIEYVDHNDLGQSIEFDLDTLEYGTTGAIKKDEIIFSPLIKQITANIQKSLDDLVLGIINFFGEYVHGFMERIDALHTIASYATNIDVLQSKAYVAHKYNYCKPVIEKNSEKSFCSFTGIRHPLIEHIQTNEIYVTNDLTLGCDGNEDGMLLFGTNAVGKTSFIKSVGISIIMAQAGLFVPCTTFRFSPYSYLFTRILGNDNLFKGLSTFAVEMSELRTILTLANKDSLILGDELCSGTESDSALSIFTAGLETLHEKRSTFMFATHFHEVTDYSEVMALERLKLAHMKVTYNREKDVLVYDRKLKDGSGETMYGLEVCKSLNLPEEFLSRANNIRNKYKKDSRNLLSQEGSHFNRAKISGLCEICNKQPGTEVHHLQHQANANSSNSYIGTFHKNHIANLINICERCHDDIHKNDKQHVKKKTSKGYEISAI